MVLHDVCPRRHNYRRDPHAKFAGKHDLSCKLVEENQTGMTPHGGFLMALRGLAVGHAISGLDNCCFRNPSPKERTCKLFMVAAALTDFDRRPSPAAGPEYCMSAGDKSHRLKRLLVDIIYGRWRHPVMVVVAVVVAIVVATAAAGRPEYE